MNVNLQKIASQGRSNTLRVLPDIIYRWSPRAMTGEKIDHSTMTTLLDAARWAPSASNNQPWHYYIAYRETKAFIDVYECLDEGNQEWCNMASALLVLGSHLHADYKNKPIPTHSFDSGASWMGLAIEATRRNLVAHAMAGYDSIKLRKTLKLTQEIAIECIIAVGVPSLNVTERSISHRKSIEEISTIL